jgi:hypothetical protein
MPSGKEIIEKMKARNRAKIQGTSKPKSGADYVKSKTGKAKSTMAEALKRNREKLANRK